MTVSEARAALPEVLTRVAQGEEVTITRYGRPIAVVVRPDVVWGQPGTEVILDETEGFVMALRERARRHGLSLRQEVLAILETAEDGTRSATPPPIRLTTVRTTANSTWSGRKSMPTRAADLVIHPDRAMLDAFVFLAATDEGRAQHRDALTVVNDWAAGGTAPCTSGQILREYLAVATRPVEKTRRMGWASHCLTSWAMCVRSVSGPLSSRRTPRWPTTAWPACRR